MLPHIDGPIAIVNVISVTPDEQQQRVEGVLRMAQEVMSVQPGFLSAEILKSVDGRRVAILGRWESIDAFRAIFDKPDVLAFMHHAAMEIPMEWHAYQAVQTVKSPALDPGY